MRHKLYAAYGSNLNLRQMKFRCPGAKLCGTGVIENYELQFKGLPYRAYATIAPREGCSVPVAIWEISKQNEISLDRYEGFPSHYFKEDVSVNCGGEEIKAMVYFMNLKMDFGLPSPYYYATVQEGYRNCGFDAAILEKALQESSARYYSSCPQQESLLDTVDDEDVTEDASEWCESDPF